MEEMSGRTRLVIVNWKVISDPEAQIALPMT
jgi:hypothetical protein